MKSFTISAAERYKNLIRDFNEECFRENMDYSERLVIMYIYHTPSVVDNISVLLLPFVDKTVQKKIVLVPKQESDQKMIELFVQK
jgi:hypothetical protein